MKQQVYQTNAEYIEAMMKKFKLVDMREQYRDLILEAEASSMDYESFLIRLLAVEEEGKRGRRTDRLRKEACFEAAKRLEDIDYSFNQSLDKEKIEEAIKHFLETFKINEKNYYATYNMAKCYMDLKKYENALEWLVCKNGQRKREPFLPGDPTAV